MIRGVIIGLVIGLCLSASARSGFQTDRFVRLIEARMSAALSMPIGPDASMNWPDCMCRVRYDGARITPLGHDRKRYEFVIETLD